MSEEDVIFSGVKVVWKGIFDLETIYKKINEWLKIKKFESIKETNYAVRIKPNGKNVEINWTATRDLDKYFRYVIEISFFVIGANEVEVEHEGEKIKMDKGEIEVKFSAKVVRDYKNEWSGKSLAKKVYEEFIIPKKIEWAKIDLYDTVTSLMSELKSFLQLYQF